jgi:hypothetical protein
MRTGHSTWLWPLVGRYPGWWTNPGDLPEGRAFSGVCAGIDTLREEAMSPT